MSHINHALRLSSYDNQIFLFLTVVLFILLINLSILFAQTETNSFEFEGINRNYIVFLPQNYDGVENLSVVFSLHGDSWVAQEHMEYTQLNNDADAAGFIVVYPNGVNNTWNYDLGGSVNDVGFIDALIDTLNNHYSIDPERIYVCGFSSGGLMCSKLACQLSYRITALATISGGIAEKIANSFEACHAMPVLSIHGTTDPTLPYNGDAGIFSAEQTVSYWKNFNNCVDSNKVTLFDKDRSDGCTVEKTTFTNGIANSSIIFFKIINGGHTWPGGAYDAPPQFGNTNRDINTNEEIWNFFKNFSLSQLSSNVTSYSKFSIHFSLFQNYPNPFNAQTIIEYQLPRAAHVRLILYNILGQKIITLIDEHQQTGHFKISWNSKDDFGDDVPSGLYIYKLETDQFSASNKLLLLR